MTTAAPFGRLLTAMVTPFTKDGAIDWAGIETLAAHLVANGHDGIVVNGTTGEAPTTKSSEKEEIIRVVRNTVGSKITVLSEQVTMKQSIQSIKLSELKTQELMDCSL